MFVSWLQRFGVFVCAASTALVVVPGWTAENRPIQYIVISFDGAREIEQWRRSRSLARETGASFTYFLSCVYLLTRENRALYDPPAHGPGKSNVGFAPSREDIAQRLRQIWTARLEGHEIASHGCGHFDGGGWSQAQWQSEFDEFARILKNAWTANDVPFEPAMWRHFAETGITGFRAPYLSVGPELAPALAAAGFGYDASGVSRDPALPAASHGVSMFALPLIPEGPRSRRILAMDYNLYVRHSAALERPSDAHLFEERAYEAFRSAFDRQYDAERAPLQLGFHFRLMNDGAYWRAMERFVRETCPLPDVRCVSYRELNEILAPMSDATATLTAQPAPTD
jgi:hypothetical protein